MLYKVDETETSDNVSHEISRFGYEDEIRNNSFVTKTEKSEHSGKMLYRSLTSGCIVRKYVVVVTIYRLYVKSSPFSEAFTDTGPV